MDEEDEDEVVEEEEEERKCNCSTYCLECLGMSWRDFF